MRDFARLIQDSLAEVGRVVNAVTAEDRAGFVEEVCAAGEIALYGVGREGLVMRALAMRLVHLGRRAHVVGDMSAPPLGTGDLLIVSAGPGSFSTVNALLDVARGAGARTMVFTAQPQGAAARRADRTLFLPAQTMADDRAAAGPLPMGSLYELALWLLSDLLVEALRPALGESAERMRARHTNLE